ncbi:MAG TPA: four helix bundle protein [Gemmatimonadaceae bacterium]
MTKRGVDYRNLEVWQRAHRLTISLYQVTRGFPDCERFCLVQQLRRAAVSIGSNIVEGRSRSSTAAYASYVDMALASGGEVSYQLLLSRDLGYLEDSVYEPLATEIGIIRNMLGALRNAVLRRKGGAS